MPELEKVDQVGEDGAVFIVNVGIKPEITLKDYKGAKIQKLDQEVTEEEIADKMVELQNKNARTISLEDGEAKLGDVVNIDYKGFVGDEAFMGGEDKGHNLELGSNTFIPGFEEQLVGVKLGEDVDVKVTFPEEYHAENLKGKDAVFKVKVNEIQVKELPELDDEFVMDISEFNTLDELKADEAKKLQEQKTARLRGEAEMAVIEYALEQAELEIPELMIREEAERSLKSMEQQIQAQGISMDDYFKYMGTNREAFLETIKPDAEKNIKVELILAKIAEAEEVLATEEEINEEIKKYADAFQKEFEEYKETVDERMKEYLDSNIKRKKTIDLLVETAVQE